MLIRQTSLPITSSGKVQRNLCREQYLADELKVVHSWINPAMRATQRQVGRTRWPCRFMAKAFRRSSRSSRRPRRSRLLRHRSRMASATVRSHRRSSRGVSRRRRIEVDRAAEQIEAWMLRWLVNRLSMDPADVTPRPAVRRVRRRFADGGRAEPGTGRRIQSAAAGDRGLELSDAGDAFARIWPSNRWASANRPPNRRRSFQRTALRFRPRRTRPSWPRSWPRSRISRTKKRRSCWRKGSKIWIK